MTGFTSYHGSAFMYSKTWRHQKVGQIEVVDIKRIVDIEEDDFEWRVGIFVSGLLCQKLFQAQQFAGLSYAAMAGKQFHFRFRRVGPPQTSRVTRSGAVAARRIEIDVTLVRRRQRFIRVAGAKQPVNW